MLRRLAIYMLLSSVFDHLVRPVQGQGDHVIT